MPTDVNVPVVPAGTPERTPRQQILHDFGFHPADTTVKRDTHAAVRGRYKNLAAWLINAVPPGRERAVAITKLEEAMFWSNAAVARGLADD